MKVLLAPLFFRKRMCKHCARSFYRENPGNWIGLHEFESLPPLGSFDTKRGFIPDFPALLMFEEFVIDSLAYQRLRHPGARTWLSQWSELVEALKAEGSLSVVDVVRAGSVDSHKRGWMLRRDLKDPQRWWQAMGYYDNIAHRAEKFLGEDPHSAINFAWKFNPDEQLGIEGSDGHVHDLSVVLLEAQRSKTKAHRKLYKHALENLSDHLREVNACVTACKRLNVAPMMWAPYRRYLQQKFNPGEKKTIHAADSGREFFKIAFPAYMPTTVRQFSKLRSNRSIHSLRSEILRATKSGDSLDPQYAQRVLHEVLRLERKAGKIRNIIGWIATAVGVIPVPGLGLASAAIGEGASSMATQHLKKPLHWFYLISDGQGAT